MSPDVRVWRKSPNPCQMYYQQVDSFSFISVSHPFNSMTRYHEWEECNTWHHREVWEAARVGSGHSTSRGKLGRRLDGGKRKTVETQRWMQESKKANRNHEPKPKIINKNKSTQKTFPKNQIIRNSNLKTWKEKKSWGKRRPEGYHSERSLSAHFPSISQNQASINVLQAPQVQAAPSSVPCPVEAARLTEKES